MANHEDKYILGYFPRWDPAIIGSVEVVKQLYLTRDKRVHSPVSKNIFYLPFYSKSLRGSQMGLGV